MGDKINKNDFLTRQVGAYACIRPAYEVFAKILIRMLTETVHDKGIVAIVQARTKGIPSFAEKAVRKLTKYPDPVNQFTDLCGARVITLCKDEIEPVRQFIRKRFDIHEDEDVLGRLNTGEFGYLSVHFIISFKENELQKFFTGLTFEEFTKLAEGFSHPEFDKISSALLQERPGKTKDQDLTVAKDWLCAYLCQHRPKDEASTNNVPPGPTFKAEVQVRTMLQHAYAEVTHDRLYKNDFKVPDIWDRKVKRVAASLEEADDDFAQTIRNVDAYKTYYGAYMKRDERKDEINKLLAVFNYDSGNIQLGHRIARLAMSLEDWPQAEHVLRKFVTQWEASPAGKAFKKAREMVLSSKNQDDREQAHIAMEELRNQRLSAVLANFGKAHWNNSGGKGREYLEWAIDLDRENVDGYIVLAKTYTEENDEDRALDYYHKAFKVAPSDPQALAGMIYCRIIIDRDLDFIPMAGASLDAAIERCRERSRVGVYLPWAFYNMGFFYLLQDKPYESLTAYAKAVQLADTESTIEDALQQIIKMQKVMKNKPPEWEWVRRFLLAAKAAKLIKMQCETEAKEKEMRQKGKEYEDIVKEKNALIKKLNDARNECSREQLIADSALIRKPMVIVAGGCNKKEEIKIQEYRPLFERAFKGFSGTIFSGCTNTGVGKLVGDLPVSGGNIIEKIAYIPKTIPSWTEKHPAYRLFCTEGVRFSALDPIQNWIDLLAMGINPSDVKVLGVNGGTLAAFEYRLAIAMGARVGILADSGRAASDIFHDGDWNTSPGLLRLPNDTETVRHFVCGYPPSKLLAEHREILAREAHETYKKDQIESISKKNPSLRDWDALPEGLKESNLQQIDHIEEKLRAAGLRVRYVGNAQVQLKKFSPDQKERMAEMEHGRWNVERLLDGWTLGEKDVERKKSPYLVAWADLPEDVKKWDYDAVLSIPEKLKKLGYEIVDDGPV